MDEVEARAQFQEGDIINVTGIFRNGVMDEHDTDTDNRQFWRVTSVGGRKGVICELVPVLQSGEPDVASYWFGRSSAIVKEDGRYGVVSEPRR